LTYPEVLSIDEKGIKFQCKVKEITKAKVGKKDLFIGQKMSEYQISERASLLQLGIMNSTHF
jgi:hypothetical protein